MRTRVFPAACATVLTLAAAGRAGAQIVNNNTTIPIIVMALFNPGTVPVPVDPAVASAVVAASIGITNDEGRIVSPITGVAVPADIAREVILMMTTATPSARDAVGAALSKSGASHTVIRQLTSNLPSLLSNPTAGQLQSALSAFNGLVNNSNAAFLVNPPAEFLAIHAILLRISTAANEVKR